MKPVTYKAFDIDELKKAFHFAKNLLEKSREYAKFLGVYVTITLGKSNRSIEQNSYMWAVVYAMIADEMGITADEVHQIYAVKFLKIKEIEIDGVLYAITKSTTKLKTDEMEDYLEKCRRDASVNLHLYIPLPNEIPEEIE